MNNTLNLYGDKKLILDSGFGADIASQRADKLDQMALDWIWHLTKKEDTSRLINALDLACGLGGQAVRMAAAGAHVIAADIVDYENEIMASCAKVDIKDRISFFRVNLKSIELNMAGKKTGQFDVIIFQRALHYLRFQEAIDALTNVRQLMARNGKLYVSVSGIGSELGNGYGHANNPLKTRFSKLALDMAEKHGIRSEVCLYNQTDFSSLLQSSGFRLEKIFTSPFGNHKAVATK